MPDPSNGGDLNGSRPVRVAIVGAGFGGLGMAIRLKQAGFYDFTIFERGESVGGVWRANTYPGATCDVPSHLYSFSFAGGRWSRRYAPRPEIMRYLEALVDEYDLRPHLRLRTAVSRASFDEQDGGWEVETERGERFRFDALVTACGQLRNPSVPKIVGAERFAGPAFHSAEWDHDAALAGRRIAVVGTGASAIQFVPAIAESAGHVDVYQRSAPWILPKPDRGYSVWEQKLMRRLPLRHALSRAGIAAFIELATYAFTGTEWVERPFRRLADRFREHELADPELLAKATPDYAFGCKRILFTNEWYATLGRDNVELHAGAVERIDEHGIVGPDGVERPADVLIWGTGFRSHEFVAPMRIDGRDGSELNEVWSDRPEAYLGTTVSGFPNLFVLYGPNTNHGSGSVPYVLECQYNLIVDSLRRLRGGVRYLDLRPEVQAAWRREIERRSADTQWVKGGCDNWYVNGAGVNTNNWPGAWREFKRRTARIDPAEFDLVR